MTEAKLERILNSKFGHVTISSGGNGTELIIDCPSCSRHKLSVNPSKGVYQCWHCHDTGTLSKLLGMRVVVDNIKKVNKPKYSGFISPGDVIPLSQLPDEHEAILYLRNRNFDPKLLSDSFGLGYCKRGKKFGGGVFDTSGTIVIPLFENGKLIAWQSRLLYDPKKVNEGEEAMYGWVYDSERQKYKVPPKYFTSPGFKKGEHFFNFDQAVKCGFVVVTEGAFDAMRVGKCAVASFGKSLTEAQIQILREHWPVVILLLDPDAESEQNILRRKIEGVGPFGGKSSNGTICVSVQLKGYKDAGEAPHSEVVRQIILSAISEGVDLKKFSKLNPFVYETQ